MGNTTAQPVLTEEQQDLKFLGDRCPFSNKEIRDLYANYQRFLQLEPRRSFLRDWTNDDAMDAVEAILPENLGNRIYETSFSATENNAYREEPNRPVDEFTRKAKLESFFEGLSVCSRRGSQASLKVLFRALETNQRVSAELFVKASYALALCLPYLIEDRKHLSVAPTNLSTLAGSIVEKGKSRRLRSGMPGVMTTECEFLSQGLVELTDIVEWSESFPMFSYILPTVFHYILFDSDFPNSRTAYEAPILNDTSDFLEPSVLFSISCTSRSLTGPYFRLFTSSNDGLSFNRLLKAIQGYGGPTLFLIRSENDGVFGAFTSSPWKESKDFYGNTDCYLFQLEPNVAVYKPSGNQRNFMYCNSYARSRGYDQQAHGIGFGGSVDEPRLFISENLDQCVASSRDLTFENGKLLESGSTFCIASLEVWGVGGMEAVEAALQARTATRDLKTEAIRRARKVDKAQFLDDFRSGALSSKAFQHRQQIDGRADLDQELQNKQQYEKTSSMASSS